MIYTPLMLFTVVTGVGECIRAELATTPAGEPDRVCLAVPGDIAWDGCDCGQLALTVNRTYGSRSFPAQAEETANEPPCGLPYVIADITVVMLRCAPGPDEYGNPPSCMELTAAALTLETDRYALRRGAACCLRAMLDADRIVDYQVGAQPSVGPEGGCVGSTMQLLIGFTSCLCPPG